MSTSKLLAVTSARGGATQLLQRPEASGPRMTERRCEPPTGDAWFVLFGGG